MVLRISGENSCLTVWVTPPTPVRGSQSRHMIHLGHALLFHMRFGLLDLEGENQDKKEAGSAVLVCLLFIYKDLNLLLKFEHFKAMRRSNET